MPSQRQVGARQPRPAGWRRQAALAVGGDSAGGNFAGRDGHQVCRDAGIKLAAQVLLYGAFDVRKDRNPDIRGPYFGNGDVEAKLNDVRASPILADLKGLAPAIMGVGPYDFLTSRSVSATSRP